jgi:predicted nucleic acid-binding OB-fold protein
MPYCISLHEQIEQKMAAKIIEEEEKRMFHDMNEQERLKSIQR